VLQQLLTLRAKARSKLSIALSGSPKFSCVLPSVTHAWKDQNWIAWFNYETEMY